MNIIRILLISTVALLFTTTLHAEPVAVTGGASFYDTNGLPITSQTPITGELNFENASASFSSFLFFGSEFATTSVELLGEGTHTRPADPISPQTITVTVGPGQLGGYFTFDWAVNTLPTFMVWDINSHPRGTSYTTIDSDGDGIPGHAFTIDPFPGFTVAFDFNEGEPPPDIEVSINVEGGNTQECAETGGSTVNLSADITLIGSAEPGSIDWTIDGEPVGSGSNIAPFLALGDHAVEVYATILSGPSDLDSTTITVRDTTAPQLNLGFLNQSGQPINSTSTGTHVNTSITASDVCDSDPETEGSATPVFEVMDGDVIKIQSGKISTVELPTTAIELSGSAMDESGNKTSSITVLTITN